MKLFDKIVHTLVKLYQVHIKNLQSLQTSPQYLERTNAYVSN